VIYLYMDNFRLWTRRKLRLDAEGADKDMSDVPGHTASATR
jgi:hypothetical protein